MKKKNPNIKFRKKPPVVTTSAPEGGSSSSNSEGKRVLPEAEAVDIRKRFKANEDKRIAEKDDGSGEIPLDPVIEEVREETMEEPPLVPEEEAEDDSGKRRRVNMLCDGDSVINLFEARRDYSSATVRSESLEEVKAAETT